MKLTACLPVLIWMLGAILGAQTTGDVKGLVTDPSGQTVAQARLTLTSTETGEARAQSADAAGRFAFNELRIGDYEVKVEAVGFRPAVSTAHVRSGETADVTFRIELGTVTGTITVTDAATPLDVTNSQIQFSV